jgi:hypothetical protein
MKNLKDSIGIRACDLPAFSTVLQPTALREIKSFRQHIIKACMIVCLFNMIIIAFAHKLFSQLSFIK